MKYVIFHDNGTAGQNGYSVYTAEEMNDLGGLDALKASYAADGITIKSVQRVGDITIV